MWVAMASSQALSDRSIIIPYSGHRVGRFLNIVFKSKFMSYVCGRLAKYLLLLELDWCNFQFIGKNVWTTAHCTEDNVLFSVHRGESGQYSVCLREDLEWYSLNWVELNVSLILTELNDIKCNCGILVSGTVYSGRNLLSFRRNLLQWTFETVKPQNLHRFSVRLLGNCLNCRIYLNLFSPICRIPPTDCNCCTRNYSKTKFVVYLTVMISQIYWRNYCKLQKPPGWPLCDTMLKNWFPRVCSRDANFHSIKLGVIWEGMEETTVRETSRCSSQLSLVTIRRWIILWHHRFDRTGFLMFLSDLGLRVHDVSHLSWKCDSTCNTHNDYL
jgi:hypothetical protein